MDMSTQNIQQLFEKQILELTHRTCYNLPKRDSRFAPGWLR